MPMFGPMFGSIENINIDGVSIPHAVIKIKGDGACLFNSISYVIYQNEERTAEVRSRIVNFVSTHWNEFSIMSHDRESNNYGSAKEYVEDMSKPYTYGGLCELEAAGKVFPFLFEVYADFYILRKFGSDINPVKRLRFSGDFSNGHFDVYLPVNEIGNNTANVKNNNTIDNYISVSCNKTEKKRRARYTNNIRKKQQRVAAINYQQTHPEVHQNAVSKYQTNNPEVHQKAVFKYQKNNPEVNQNAVSKYKKNNPEIQRAAQARYESSKPEKRRELRLRSWKAKFCSGFAYDPDINYENDIGEMKTKCPFCNAKRFTRESHNICCSNGKVQLQPLLPPPEPLHSLIMGNHHDHRHFLDHIRQYNGCFQMTSFGAKQVVENGFMPTFKVQGQVYHLFGSLQPKKNQEPQFLQIYFVGDDEKEASIRSSKYSGIKFELVRELQGMLHEVNNYVKDFKIALENVSPTCENFQVVIHAERKPATSHKGRYNAPTTSEVALVIVGQQFEQRDVIIESRESKVKRISELHRSYDALQYPLMFCHGEDGYSINVHQKDPNTKQPITKTVSATQFYSFRIMSRDGENNYLLRYCALLSQFLVDEYAKIETEKLNFLRHNQSKLRAEEYIHLRDDVGKSDADQLGQRVILPSSFNGGPRYMHERAQDAMTYVRKFGGSDLFVTFTCNPKWKEIQRELYPGQKHYQRHDIIARVFNLKVKELMDLIIKGQIFGKVRCYMFTVEWQKRGLPHIHLLLWLKDGITNDMIDKVVCAEIPDPQRDPLLYDVIKSNMIHGPCGSLNRNSPCMKDGSCTKRYPRPLVQETQKGEDSYPLYRRRSPEDGGFVLSLKGVEIDNRWIVPYNPVLSRTFDAHINVEITNSVKAIKYICKYVTKGNDQAVFALEKSQKVNEIEMYENGRYISTSEAVWRILSFPIHDRYPTVTHLAVHLENGQRVYFNKDNLNEKLANPPITTLLAFFNLCQNDDFARTLLYPQVPSYYVFQPNKIFTRRKRGEDVAGWPGVKKDAALGRVYTIHPNNIECFHLRLLLHNVQGPTSFSQLKTVNNVEYPTFKAACMALGLLENDKHWEHTIDEAVVSCSAFQLRELFTIILIFCSPSDPQSLWNKYKESFSEDIMYCVNKGPQDCATLSKEDVFNQCLILIEDGVLALGGQCLSAYGLPKTIRYKEICQNREYVQETNYDIGYLIEKISNGESSLTEEQLTVYNTILSSVETGTGQIFFLDSPGGTGKTFLINIILAKVRSKKYIAIAAASSGIAATLMDGGKTAHSAFKLPLNLNYSENPLCNIKKQSPLAQVLRQCKLIVWDEITMAHKGGIEALNSTLRDIRNSNELMGGVTVLLAGDFRQTLPVIPRGTRANEVKACIKSSYLWPHVQKLSLKRNMRVHLKGDSSAAQFSHILLEIGDGKYPESGGKVTIPPELGMAVITLEELISKVYCEISDIKNKSIEWLCERAILSPKNDKAAEINNILLDAFAGEDLHYKSIDKTIKEDEAVQYPTEFLNTLNPPGFPPHMLRLKVGTPVMMIRNLCPPKLCNGTRLQIISLYENLVEARIITGSARGEIVVIPRIPLIPSDYPFQFTRLQFPIQVCFATTINKSQGQSLKIVGVDLREDCFSHGQLYVACSRVSSPKDLIILALNNKTKNIVYKEVLS